MDERIEALRAWGCDVDGTLGRMLNDEAFYIECLYEAYANPNFKGLEDALADGAIERAFDCAHALKGVLGNIGLTPMYMKTIELVEPLRAGRADALDDKLESLMLMRRRLAEVLKC